jgi:hypothetical protein
LDRGEIIESENTNSNILVTFNGNRIIRTNSFISLSQTDQTNYANED